MSRRLTTEEFITRCKKIHNNLYDYSKVEYNRYDEKVCIIDPKYGEFWQLPTIHLGGHGCPKRAPQKIAMTTEKFIEKANNVHHNLYNYSKATYKTTNVPICIIDPDYGDFWQRPADHLTGSGCPIRSNHGKATIHKDHIIPLSILDPSRNRNKKRPLYKFLNSDINLQMISDNNNKKKSDWIEINGEQQRARYFRNNYEIIAHLSETLLDTNITDIINDDWRFLSENM